MKSPSFDTNRSCLGDVLPIDTPFRFTIDISEVCNFKCSYCFRSENPSESWGYALKNEVMTMDVFKKIVVQIKQFPKHPNVISLSGMGEPLCNKNIVNMVKYLKEMGIKSKIEIHTNASLIDEKLAKEIATSGIDKMVISLQGLDEIAYKKICNFNIDFDEFHKNLTVLYENKSKHLEINIKIVDAALRNKGEETLFYEMFSGISDKIFVEKTMALWQEQIEYEEDVNDKSNKFGKNFGHIECCPIAFVNLTIAPNGDIYPCCVINPPFSLGNIEQVKVVEAWRSEKRIEFLKDILVHGRKCHSRCETCYFPKGYVKTEMDIIDSFRDNIIERIINNEIC